MTKQAKKEVKKGFPLLTTNQSNAYRQQVKKQSQVLDAGNNIKMERIMQTNPDPNYLSIFKKSYNPITEVHQLDELEVNEYKYDNKMKRDRHFNIKMEGATKETMNAPITANQEYGWRAPIDVFPTNFGMKQTFDQSLFVTLKKNKQVPKK